MHFFKPLIKFVHQVCITNKVKTNNNKKIYINMSSTPPPQTTLYCLYVHYMRNCNAERQKWSAKGFNFKEDDSVLPSIEECRILSRYIVLKGYSHEVGCNCT